jgi:predicted RNA-binding protein with PIN domain
LKGLFLFRGDRLFIRIIMPLELIIDGYNLIRQSDTFRRLDARSLEQGREALLQRLVEYKKVRGHPITVVFDGWGSFNPFSTDTRHKGISVVYTGKGELADDYIKRTVAKIQYGAVVTSDQEVKRHAERLGVPAIASPVFERKMEAALADDIKGADPDEEEWDEEELVEAKKKGTAWRLSKQERRRQAILKKL